MAEFRLSPKSRIRCRCGKIRGMNEADAKMLYEYATRKSGHRNDVRFYRCTFGGYHWTRMLDVNGPEKLPYPPRKCASEDCSMVFAPINEVQRFCRKECRDHDAMKKYVARHPITPRTIAKMLGES